MKIFGTRQKYFALPQQASACISRSEGVHRPSTAAAIAGRARATRGRRSATWIACAAALVPALLCAAASGGSMGRALCERCTRPESVCVCKALPDAGKIALQTKVPAAYPPPSATASTSVGRAPLTHDVWACEARAAARCACDLHGALAWAGADTCAVGDGWRARVVHTWSGPGSFEARTASDARRCAVHVSAWVLAWGCCGGRRSVRGASLLLMLPPAADAAACAQCCR